MSTKEHVYGEVNSPGDLKRIFAQIRSDVAMATSREGLTDLYGRAAYLGTLTYSPAWEKKNSARRSRNFVRSRSKNSARRHTRINERARAIGADADYDE